MKLYNAEKGSWPTTPSCLGKTTTYVGGNEQCWNNAYWIIRPALLNELAPYISNYPEPDTTDIGASVEGGSPIRGALYNTDGTTYWQIYVVLSGTQPCPSIGIMQTGVAPFGSGQYCVYSLV